MAFYPGQQVVCISAGCIPEATNNYPHMLQEGNVYTIRDIIENPKFGFLGYGVYLDSVWLPKCDATGLEEAWHPCRFRPCTKTDIGVFKEILQKIPLRKQRCDA